MMVSWGMLLVVAVVASVVLLAAGKGKARRGVGLILAAVVGLVCLGGLFFARSVGHQVRVPAQARPMSSRVRPVHPIRSIDPPRRSGLPPIRIDADNAEFLADVYPSARQAVRALANQAAARLGQLAEDTKAPSKVQVAMTAPSPSDQALADVVVEIIQKKSGPAQKDVQATTQPARAGPVSQGTARVDVAVKHGPARSVPGLPGREEAGDVTLRLQAGGRTETFTTSYVTKEWVDNFALFASRQHGDVWIVGRCGRPWPTEEEARREAMDRVGEALLERVRKSHVLSPRVEANGPEWMRQQAAAIARRRGMIRDHFVQSFRRPYGGTLWQHAVLVNPRRGDITMIPYEMRMAAGTRRSAWVRTLGARVLSIGVVLVAILLAYAFLNAATKGYYVWALRVAAGALVAGGILLVLALS